MVGTVSAQTFFQRSYSSVSCALMEANVAWSDLDQTFVISTLEYSVSSVPYLRVIKTDQQGYPVWSERFLTGDITRTNIVVDPAGMIYTVNCTGGINSSTDISYIVTAITPWGTINWSKEYQTSSELDYDQPSISILADGNLLITESVWGHVGFLKITPSGALIKAVSIAENTPNEIKTPGFASAVAPDGSFLFTGKRGPDILLARADDQGNLLWARQWNAGINYYQTKTICALGDGSSIMGGFEEAGPFLMKVDANGNSLWYKTFLGYGTVRRIVQLNVNEFIVHCESNEGDITLLKVDGNGTILNAILMAADNDISYSAGSVCITPQGKISWVGNYLVNSTGEKGITQFIMDSFSATGCGMQTIYPVSYPSSEPPLPLISNVLCNDQVIITAPFGGSTASNPLGYLDFCWVVAVPAILPPLNEFTIQNSPAEEGVTVTFALGTYRGDLVYYVVDAFGREVINKEISYSGGMQPIDNSDKLAPGIYLMTTVSNGETQCKKFVIK
jgi:hypothetical protein